MKFNFLKKHLTAFILIISTSFCIAQQTTYSLTNHFSEALNLYNNKAYSAAQKIFTDLEKSSNSNTQLHENISYYNALCAIHTKDINADKIVLNFVQNNPNSSKSNRLIYTIANYYFGNKKPAYALKWYLKIDKETIEKEFIKEINFKMGYSYLATKNYVLAKNHFLVLINDPKYGNDARYYYGFIAYKLEDYGIAGSTLKEIEDSETYKAEISYYLLDISFKAGKFKHCINVGKELIKTVQEKDKSEIYKIIGESYFNLEKYGDAIPYLKKYTGKNKKWNNVDFYQLGYAYYKQNDFKNAINYFNKIIDEKNFVAQNAYYHLGECYLKLDQKPAALNAFKTASELSFSPQIKEDAALNYAKLSYEIGNPFKSVPVVLKDYLKSYPKSAAYDEINKLVIASYIHQQKYQEAIDFLSKKPKQNKEAILEISLYIAFDLFNAKKLIEANSLFAKSKLAINDTIALQASYWEAETYYRLNDYKESLNKYISLSKLIQKNAATNYNNIQYAIGYNYFQLKQYKNSTEAFNLFLKAPNTEINLQEDAKIRIGDSYFATREYNNALKLYKEIVDKGDLNVDYAQFQVAMSYGFLNENDLKIKTLTNLITQNKNSNLLDDALYNLAITYTKTKQQDKAHKAYNQLIEEHSKSVFIPKALVRQGLLYYNDNKNEEALKRFKTITSKFPNAPEAFEAVANARNIYIEKGDLNEYISWTSNLKFINITNTDIDNTSFKIAEKKYLKANNNKEATNSILKYLIDFPKGIHKIKANYYLADLYYKQGEIDKSIQFYEIILQQEQNEYSEESLSKISEIYLGKNDYNNAIHYLDRLEQEAYEIENILFAQSNLMNGYFKTEAFELAIEYAKKILLKDKISPKLENDAKIIIAKAAIEIKDDDTAKKYYNELEKSATGILKAEALYYNAYFKNKNSNYEESNKIIQQLIADYSSYKNWAIKSYIIMGKNYNGLKDPYQATFIFENIIKNFKEFEEIIKEAENELAKIKKEEAKRNNSVMPTSEESINKDNLKNDKND